MAEDVDKTIRENAQGPAEAPAKGKLSLVASRACPEEASHGGKKNGNWCRGRFVSQQLLWVLPFLWALQQRYRRGVR